MPKRDPTPAPSGLPDLHRHLDGSLRPETLEELALRCGRVVPDDLLFRPLMGLSEALARFEFTLSLIQQPAEVERVASEIVADAAADGVTTLEVRFAPQLHRGASAEAIVDAALRGLESERSPQAGLILCGLFGEDPLVLHSLVECAGSRGGVVGIDLAGGPAPGHAWRLEDYAPAFERARELGLGRTVHAGEGRPPAEIRAAVELLGAQRIGHGTTLLEDPGVLELVLERGVVIEACPTSNVHTGVLGSVRDHPLPRWLDAGVAVCVNTDNTLLSAVTASAEHARAAEIPGMDEGRLRALLAHGHAAAFPLRSSALG